MHQDPSTIDILDRLIAFPTVSRDSNLAMIDWIQDFLETRGFSCHRVPDPTGTKAGLFARIGQGEGGVLLSAHTDVVPVDGQNWTSDPFALTHRDGRYYGRGTCDMKGFLAASLAAADRASRMTLAQPLKLAISYDEEIGCVGIAHMIDRLAPTIGLPRAAIIGEPTEMNIVNAHKGKRVMRAHCTGTAGHSSMAPQFQNALHLACDLLQAIRTTQDHLMHHGAHDTDYITPFSTLHAGKMAGGVALNMVPETATLDFELRHLPADDPAAIIETLHQRARDITDAARATHPRAAIRIEELNAYPALATPADAPITGWLGGLCDHQQPLGKVDFGTEAGMFAAAGAPSLVCGPGSIRQAHKPDEYIEATELRRCDALLTRILGTMTAA
ncbi:acetylornithine deacetylase [Oceaniglobus ichthyenteri]|uniref:acetylornithine deacetylase n=1 Tax=Oceaniglobus ichthyenteri TaxID=2136177 RepID=UPI000D38459E|nr:acetylornithine deacetylase [Oceaniglobus ichthyenteri]